MHNTLRAILIVDFGLPSLATDEEAKAFYAKISQRDKERIAVEMSKISDDRTDQAADGITVRSGPDEEIRTRSATVVPSTLNEEARTVDVVLATEDPIVSMDARTRRGVLEVLLMDGARLPEQIPLLNEHQRSDVRQQLGSFRNLRVEGDQLLATMHVSSAEDGVWTKVKEGHIRDVSVGSRPFAVQRIPPGSQRNVGGSGYQAPANRELFVNTDWEPVEGSLTWKGADRRTKVRTEEGLAPMNEKLRTYLESIGLRSDATEDAAQAFYDSLSDEARTRADAGENEPPEVPPTPPETPEEGTTRTVVPADSVDHAAIATQAVADERDRVRSLTELAGEDVAPETLRTALQGSTTLEEAAPLFLQSVRQHRGPSGPALHSRSHDGDCTTRSLAAGMMIGQGMEPADHFMHDGQRSPGRRDRLTENDADSGDRFRSMSAMDLCRECVRIDGGRVTHDRSDTIRAAMSGTSLSSVFSTSINARLIEAFQAEGDTTQGWVDELDVNNFQEQEDITFNGDAELDILPSGGTANHATASDSSETYRIARFAKQFVMDEQTVIDDRFGALLTMAAEMGEAARQVRPNLVYALMLENPTMSDTGEVFNNTAVTTEGGHANLSVDAMGAEGLRNAITSMATQRLNRTADQPGDPLNIRAKYVIVPPDLKWTTLGLLQSTELQKVFADSDDSEFANINLLAMQGLIPVVDARIDALGVKDPKTKTVRTGSATNWFLAEGGRRGLRVAYLAGTGRAPQLRSFELSQGQWGRGWDIKLDIGAAFNEWRTWHKSTGVGA